VKLAEEEYSVYRASDLFLRILEEYLVKYPEANSQEIFDISSLEQEDEILHAAVEKLNQISRQDRKRFIIFVENLHELFKQLEKEELHKLRSIFQKYDIFSVVATAPLIFPSLSGHDEPFYNFFHIQYLKEFTYHEIKELMQKIAETENGEEFFEKFGQYEERIHGLVHLTGGSPRLVFLFYDMITGGEIENIEKAFFKIIDEHTPFYQEIFQMLTGQQRLIFDVLISFGETATPKQISEKARIKLQTVSTQLRRLETDGYVISRPMGRHTKYEVRERLFRLWREMRQPFGRKRVSILLDFLQLWYTGEERKELFKTKFELLEAGEESVLRDLCYYAEIQPPEFKTEALLKLTPKLIDLGERDEAIYEIGKLKETAARTKDKELDSKILFYEGQLLFSNNKYQEAIEVLNKILKMNPKDKVALSNKGSTLLILGKYDEALETFNEALEINPKNELILLNKGFALVSLGKYEKAIETFNKALEINPKYEYALLNKGWAFGCLGMYEEAFETFNEALEINPKNELTLSNIGGALVSLGKYEEALENLNEALEINPKHEYALLNKSLVLKNLGKYEGALETVNKVLEINPKHEYALLNKSLVLKNLGKYEGALETVNKVLEINPKHEYALLNKGSVLENLGKYEGALETFNKVLEINPKHENTLTNKALLLMELERYDEGLKVAKKTLDVATEEHSKIDALLIIIGAYISLNRKAEAALEIYKIKGKMANQDLDLIEDFIELCLILALEELEDGNRGNADKFIKTAFENSSKLETDIIKELTMNFLKAATDSGELHVIKAAAEDILDQQKDEFTALLRPITKAIEIIETRDLKKYYDLQIEEREIVADVVKKITKSDELVPDEIKNKDSR
jgi:tetratricopeptide (TPR) repeat protein